MSVGCVRLRRTQPTLITSMSESPQATSSPDGTGCYVEASGYDIIIIYQLAKIYP